MSDIMHPISIEALLNWIFSEYQQDGTIFGTRKFYHTDPTKTISLFGEKMETPCGPAAGPHIQLAQNIITVYLTGSCFFEVKTAQTLDKEDLPVSKPYIAAADECYNVEWSTELHVPQAYDEYVKAWFVSKLLSKEFELGSPNGFIFNMSVGYDLAGTQSPKTDCYISEMQNAEETPIWTECQAAAKKYLSYFKKVDDLYIETISPKACHSITLSTLYGCPSDEIERVAAYLLSEKRLHSFIKRNPTMLGYEYAHQTMDELGFNYMVFDDHHSKEDLQFGEAVPMLQRLQLLANSRNLSLGVKITNTFPITIAANELPGDEMYMSGRPLFPLSISLAQKLSEASDGKLQTSYSDGAGIFNSKEIFDAGIWPITMATTLLEPGGYQRMNQVASVLSAAECPQMVHVNSDKLAQVVEKAKTQARYQKSIKLPESTELRKTVPLTDCHITPCRGDGGCPINQNIPAYLRHVSEGNYLKALQVVIDKNLLPFITGTICAHPCTTKCTRQFYEESIHTREVKLEAAEYAYDELLTTLEKPQPEENAPKIAVVGGGPAGISAGYLLAREGMPITVFEKSETIGGVYSQIVPEFRVSMESVQKDVQLAEFMRAEFRTGQGAPSPAELKNQGYTNVIYAIGTWKHGVLRLGSGRALNSLEFLKANRENPTINPYEEQIVVVGGGNIAMDCARAATTLPGIKKVSVVYRRNKRNMPADEEELYLALGDGVDFLELLSPIEHENQQLTCEKMVLDERDTSGHRRPIDTGGMIDIPADTVIAAVGEKVDAEFYQALGIHTDNYGKVVSNQETLETDIPGVCVIGDVSLGPATIVEAIADTTKAANNICLAHNHHYEEDNLNSGAAFARNRRGTLVTDEMSCSQASRCLEYSTICESCMDVCPNRTSIIVYVEGKPRIVHVDRMCNECGNCETFCPYASAPYKDKFTLFNSEAGFYDSTNSGFYVQNSVDKIRLLRLWGTISTIRLTDQGLDVPEGLITLMVAMIEEYAYCVQA